MPLENLTIQRVCLHEIYRRSDERTKVNPTFASALLAMDASASSVFVSRVVSAFKSDAQCMEMAIKRHSEGSVLHHGASLIEADDTSFVANSRHLASLLADAQVSRQIPGGVVAVFNGTVGYPESRFFAVMKAELHDGFLKQKDLQATFVKDLFLSPKTKLYKIGFFEVAPGVHESLPNGWTATVYDSQMTAAYREGAALYFHNAYLGLEIPENSAHQIKRFFECTKSFIKSADMEQEQKVDLYNGLYTYLKVGQSSTAQVSAFAENYMPEELRVGYREHMRQQKVPAGAIVKDLSEVTGSLKLRRFRFPQKIILTGPPDAIKQLVVVESLTTGDEAGWTRITVKGRLEGQE